VFYGSLRFRGTQFENHYSVALCEELFFFNRKSRAGRLFTPGVCYGTELADFCDTLLRECK
jgi:hypothetical protein